MAPDGKPRDPWSKAYRALLIELSPPHGDLTFSGSSYGTELGFKALSGAVCGRARAAPRHLPCCRAGDSAMDEQALR